MAKLMLRINISLSIRQLTGPLLLLLLVAVGCSQQNVSTTEPHPVDFFSLHGAEATAALESCRVCHGINFSGSGDAVNCFDCHVEGPPFGIHPEAWTDVLVDHELFAVTLSWTSCAVSACHGKELRGGTSGPSCFAAGCHPGGGGPPAPHGLPYFAASDHGPAAKPDQFYCRNCHGRPPNIFDGGFVADPGILNRAAGDCSTFDCHPAAKAHPTNWQGAIDDTDPTYDSSHQGVSQDTEDSSCALCHNTTASGSGPLAGAPGCFAASFTNADGSTSGCHPRGPGPAHPLPYADANLHGPDAKDDLAFCQTCHGIPGTILFNGGITSTSCSDVACHPYARAHPTDWRSGHRNAGNQSVSCSICHDFTQGRTAPDPAATLASCYTASFTNAEGTTSGCHAGGPGDDD